MEEEGQSLGKPGKQPPELPTPIFFFINNAKELPIEKNNVEEVIHGHKAVIRLEVSKTQKKNELVLKQFEVHQQWRTGGRD